MKRSLFYVGSDNAKIKTLWSNIEKTRQFLIDDTVQLPPGDFVLRTPTGRKQLVDFDSITDFEVTKEEAQAWLKEQLGQVTRQLGAGLRDRFKSNRQQDEKNASKNDQDGSYFEKKPNTTPGLDLLADITGTPRDSLAGDYGAIGRSLRSYLGDVVSTIGDGVSGDSQRETLARERMHDWSDVLKKHGVQAVEMANEENATAEAAEKPADFFKTSSEDTESEPLKRKEKFVVPDENKARKKNTNLLKDPPNGEPQLSNKTLWSNQIRTRQFLIPDDADLISGDFVLRSVTGRQRLVHSEAIVAFEVTREEAQVWLKSQFNQAIEKTKSDIQNVLNQHLNPSVPHQSVDKKQVQIHTGQTPITVSSGLALFSKLSGESSESIKTDVEALNRGVIKIMELLGKVVDDSISTEPAHQETARQRLLELQEILLQHGISVDVSLQTIQPQLQSFFGDIENSKNRENTAEQLENLAEGLEQTTITITKKLRLLSQQLRDDPENSVKKD